MFNLAQHAVFVGANHARRSLDQPRRVFCICLTSLSPMSRLVHQRFQRIFSMSIGPSGFWDLQGRGRASGSCAYKGEMVLWVGRFVASANRRLLAEVLLDNQDRRRSSDSGLVGLRFQWWKQCRIRR